MSDDPVIKALYSPGKQQVACVLIQAAYGGDRRACEEVQDWCVDIVDDFMMIAAPLSQWRAIGRMPRDKRPGPDMCKQGVR